MFTGHGKLATEAWAAEFQKFEMDNLNNYVASDVGHAAQVIRRFVTSSLNQFSDGLAEDE